MDRRSFLRGATVVGSGVIAGGALVGCSNPSSRSANPKRSATSSTTTTTGQGPPDWATLSGSLIGTLLQPSDSGYASAGHLYNALYVPNAAAVAQCESATDVQCCLAFSREPNVEATLPSG